MATYSTTVIESTDALPRSQWDHVISNSEYSTIYHDVGYLKAIEHGMNKQAAHIVVSKNDNPVGLLPNFIVPVGKGTPFDRLVSLQPGSGSFVLTGDEIRVLEELSQAVHEYSGGKLVSHTIRADPPQHLLINQYLRDKGYRPIPGANFELDLSQGWDEIEEKMSKDRRYDLRKAREQSYEIQEREVTQDTLDEFYERFTAKMDEINTSAKPKSYFEILFENLSENVMLLSIHCDGECRGYHLYLLDEYQSTIRHQYMAILRDDFQYYPGELLHEYGIKWGISNGYDYYNLGGGKADIRSGTTDYKRQYGGRIVPFITWEKEFSNIFKLGRFIFRRI